MKFDEFNLDMEEFSLEHLLDSEENLELIEKFSAPNNAMGLENYLKYSAIYDEERNYGRTYLVKDKSTSEVVCYFSLRTGLITMQTLDSFGGMFDTIPAIELSNFAVNLSYRKSHPVAPKFGFMVFEDFIFPLVRELAKYVGVNALYIYALPSEHLIGHYKTMGFNRLSPEDEKFVQKHVKLGIINRLSASLLEAEAEKPKRPRRSFGMAKGELRYPDDIDFCNDEIAAMFGVDVFKRKG